MIKMRREGGGEMAIGAIIVIYSINVFECARSNDKKKEREKRKER